MAGARDRSNGDGLAILSMPTSDTGIEELDAGRQVEHLWRTRRCDKDSQRRVAGLAVSADTLRISWRSREFLEQPNESDSMIDYTYSNHPERHDRLGPRWLSLDTSTLTPV
ncbi:MAG: hypothetical protein VYB08_18975 [Candidatus Latescibacterota bacterium]|nr:hypothetical protein [Candidatus Latescibacterota bacterium]